MDGATDRVTPQNVSHLSLAQLRGLGFTRQKAGYCLDLARLVVAGGLDLAVISRAGDEEARAALLKVRGIGPWSADVYLLMALGRPDVWPDGDVALAAAAHRIKRLRRRPDFDRLGTIAAKWRPWRSVAARILWHHYLSERRERALRT